MTAAEEAELEAELAGAEAEAAATIVAETAVAGYSSPSLTFTFA